MRIGLDYGLRDTISEQEMPTIEFNKGKWDATYDWNGQGEEWSEGWNGSESQWFFSIYPRIHAFLPAQNVVEIAPGYGRWTAYLLPHCGKYSGFDLATKCVDACRERFKSAKNARFDVTDGVSLPGIKDKSVDFLFSFDSLIHVEIDILEGYIKEMNRTLSADGVAFIHHSNANKWREIFAATDKMMTEITGPIPNEVRVHLMKSNLCGLSVSAELFAEACLQNGLRCRSQEIIDWNNPLPQNCLSTICRQGSKWDRPTKRYEHTNFMAEMRHIARMGPLYSERYSRE